MHLPESNDPERVSVAVKSFIDADMPVELIELLEKIILEPSVFSDNSNLQNLLMLTAAKSDKSQLVDLVVEDHQAEEVDRVRARKEGGPGWNEVPSKHFV